MKIVFFGSGPVAAKSLKLLADTFEIEAVVTKPRAEHHKGSVPVLDACEQLEISRVLQVINKCKLSELFTEKVFESQIGVVIDFGIIIDQDVIDSFKLGIINSHFSLLPEWRGADPITFSILSGQSRTGVSLMLINGKMDEGDLIAQGDYELSVATDTKLLTHDLIDLSDCLLREFLPLYVSGKVHPVPQLEATIARTNQPTYSRKLTKADGILDFKKPATQLEREIRAFIEWPRSRLKLGGLDVIVTKAHVSEINGVAGNIFNEGSQLGLYCSEGILIFDSLIPAGKKEMDTSAFLAGYKV